MLKTAAPTNGVKELFRYDAQSQSGIGLSDLSVVILTYNRPHGALEIIRRLPPGLEVIVVDDGSDQDPDVPEGVQYVSLRPKEGIRAATCRNEGAARTRRGKILFLDDDVLPHSGLCFGHVLALNMVDASLGALPREGYRLESDSRFCVYFHQSILWRFCFSGNLAVKRAAFEQVGGFDALYDGGHGAEDLDLGRRLARGGFQMLLNPLAIATHPQPMTSSTPSEAVIRNMKKFEEKWKVLL